MGPYQRAIARRDPSELRRPKMVVIVIVVAIVGLIILMPLSRDLAERDFALPD